MNWNGANILIIYKLAISGELFTESPPAALHCNKQNKQTTCRFLHTATSLEADSHRGNKRTKYGRLSE